VALYAAAIVALWFIARPYGDLKWKLACASGLVAAAVAMITNQAISHLWERPRPFVTHQAFTHLLSAPSPDPSFPSDHAAVAFAIAFGVLAFSRRAGILFLIAATLISLSRIAPRSALIRSDARRCALVGWAAALLTVSPGGSGWHGLVVIVSRVSDPVLERVWLGSHNGSWRCAASGGDRHANALRAFLRCRTRLILPRARSGVGSGRFSVLPQTPSRDDVHQLDAAARRHAMALHDRRQRPPGTGRREVRLQLLRGARVVRCWKSTAMVPCS
jgi:hypothetical protein